MNRAQQKKIEKEVLHRADIRVRLTVFKNSGRLSKEYRLAPDGGVDKNSGVQFAHGSYRVETFIAADVAGALAKIGQMLDGLTSREAIGLGVPLDGSAEGEITTKARFAKFDTDAIPRSKEFFGWLDGPAPLLLDGDDIDGLPAILNELYPPFADVAVLSRPSASASVIDPQTGEAMQAGEHCYVLLDKPELSRDCLHAFMRLAWVCGRGSLKLSKSGAVLIRGPVDASVASAERLSFEGRAVVGPGLTELPRISRVIGGIGMLRADALLAYADRHAPKDQFDALVAAAKNDPEFCKQRAAAQAAYRGERIEEAVAQGVPREEAEAEYERAAATSFKKGAWTFRELMSSHVLYFPDGKPFTVGDIQKDPRAFHERECADPIEGLRYSSRNCAIIYAQAPQLRIYSRAHGDAFAYCAPLEEIDWSKTALGEALRKLAEDSEPVIDARNQLRIYAVLAEAMLRRMRERDEDLCIVADEKDEEHYWRYSGGLWSLVRNAGKWIELQIEKTLRDENVRNYSHSKFVTEARKYIERSPDVRTPGGVAWDDHGKVPTQSGLIDPVTLEIEPLAKEHYATWRLDVAYDPAAACPLWLELLGDYFDDQPADEREKRITLLQDFSGTILIDRLPKALKRALVLLGASDTGKSILLRVLSGLLTDKPISTALSDISGAHGLQEFMRRAPWVLDEAFDISVWHLSSRVKAIIAREPLSINPKNEPLITMRINAPPLWGTNHPPTFKENTDAIVNRLLIVKLRRVFDKDKLVGVAAKAKAVNPAWEPSDLILAHEKAGLLNWMLTGLQRVLQRGNFVNTAEGEAALDEMRLDANPVSGFIRDCIRFDPTRMMSTTDFYAAFAGWRQETHGDEKVGLSPHFVGKNLAALSHPRIGQDKNAFKEKDGKRYYIGVALNDEGCAHFNALALVRYSLPEGPFKRMSATAKEVGRVIPDKWWDHPEVVRLTKLAADEATQPRRQSDTG